MALSDQGRDIARRVFEVGFGVAVVVAISIISKKTDIHSFVDDTAVGLLTVIATAFILEPFEQKRLTNQLNHKVSEVKAEIKELRSSINAVHGEFADHIDRYTLALRFTNKNLDRDEMPNAWERMLWSMRGNFDATSYVKPSDYMRSYPDLGIAIQEAKVRVAKARIRRIFIVESENELNLIGPHIAKQMAAGVEVSYVLLEEIKQHVQTDKFDTLDFGLFDDSKSVFLWLLNERSVSGGKIELETDQYAKYRGLFDLLCRISHSYRELLALKAG
ncbi:hypothetical protein [Granulicella tundricola]|uniref:Uncharacterized protein n=1 Tax=Granulicella tundricola (strain ATCC BAA-1859 / DSM 23138 / MP5ACTX9) TaxID=1198114 RepID=E8X239_GRATM|nr:hypothetical protein [Granulicella tundricola]ADW70282.1 hypothetical protein AciX9_3271 [Granulicella tundricola MP5ACTX9]